MKLRIRQRVLAFTDSYDVYDEFGEARYFVRAELIALGHQIHVYDKQTGREVWIPSSPDIPPRMSVGFVLW